MKKVLIGLFILFLAIQLFRSKKNADAAITPVHIAAMYPMSDSVHQILDKACMDCHSNNTRYPWYNNIQPAAWFMAHHVDEAKAELNFSEFGNYKITRQAKKMKEVLKAVQEGWMPLDSYKWIHKDAILTDNEKNLLIDWASNISEQIATKLPADGK